MYKGKKFIAADDVSVVQLMRDYPFAILMCVDEMHLPVATQIPFLVEERADGLHLVGHVMRKTDHWQAMKSNPSVRVLFTGPHAYISASWYTNPLQASTWNYMTVQATGKVEFLDADGLRDVLEKVTIYFENAGSSALYANIDESYIQQHLTAIEAIDIKVEELTHTFKLSQNKDPETFSRIIDQLENGNEEQRLLAAQMMKHRQ